MIILRNSYYSSPYYGGGISDLEERLFGIHPALTKLGSGKAAKASQHFFDPLTRSGHKELAFYSGPKTKKKLGENVHALVNRNESNSVAKEIAARGATNGRPYVPHNMYLFDRPF